MFFLFMLVGCTVPTKTEQHQSDGILSAEKVLHIKKLKKDINLLLKEGSLSKNESSQLKIFDEIIASFLSALDSCKEMELDFDIANIDNNNEKLKRQQSIKLAECNKDTETLTKEYLEAELAFNNLIYKIKKSNNKL